MASQELKISNKDCWFKIVGMLQQNWAIIEPGRANNAWSVLFIDDNSGVFNQIEFHDVAEAERQLSIYVFERFAENKETGSFIAPPPPPFHKSSHPNGPIYSSGRHWKSK